MKNYMYQLNIPITKELHEKIKKVAITKSVDANKLISVTKVVREVLEKQFK